MARVIKAEKSDASEDHSRPRTRNLFGARVIDKAAFQAQAHAAKIRADGEEEKRKILLHHEEQIKITCARARELGASRARAVVAQDAIAFSLEKASAIEKYAEDLRELATQIVKKIIGDDVTLKESDVRQSVSKGMKDWQCKMKSPLTAFSAEVEDRK